MIALIASAIGAVRAAIDARRWLVIVAAGVLITLGAAWTGWRVRSLAAEAAAARAAAAEATSRAADMARALAAAEQRRREAQRAAEQAAASRDAIRRHVDEIRRRLAAAPVDGDRCAAAVAAVRDALERSGGSAQRR